MEIIALFNRVAAEALRKNTPSGSTEKILTALRQAGAVMKPLHPDSDDPELNRYFVIQVSGGEKAEELSKLLRSFGPTEAAYIKPAGEAP